MKGPRPEPGAHVQQSRMHQCECRSTERTLVLLARDVAGSYPEFERLRSDREWSIHSELGAVRVPLGEGHPWAGLAELSHFLRGILDPERYDALRAAWIDRGVELEEQLVRLIHARPLAEMVSVDSSPLVEMLEEKRLETWYQPVISAATGEVWGYECLLRGRTAEGELVAPGTILEWARQEHLTLMLDRLSRETHLRNAGKLGLGDGCRFLINFIPTTIYRPEFCLQTTLRASQESGLAPGQVIFEVVESERVTDRDHLRDVLAFYRETGFGVALDDVGSGYSGLTLLGDLAPDLIKIDRGLVSRAAHSASHREICASLVKLGQGLGQLVLAEGVETEDERRVMEELGVDLFQGYFFGRPDPVPLRLASAA